MLQFLHRLTHNAFTKISVTAAAVVTYFGRNESDSRVASGPLAVDEAIAAHKGKNTWSTINTVLSDSR